MYFRHCLPLRKHIPGYCQTQITYCKKVIQLIHPVLEYISKLNFKMAHAPYNPQGEGSLSGPWTIKSNAEKTSVLDLESYCWYIELGILNFHVNSTSPLHIPKCIFDGIIYSGIDFNPKSINPKILKHHK